MNTSDLAEARRLAQELTVWARDYATTDQTDEMASKSAVSLMFLADENERLRTALQRIATWDEHPVEMAVDYGSNGVRDHYRRVALDALGPDAKP
jgi:hypothetical protein